MRRAGWIGMTAVLGIVAIGGAGFVVRSREGGDRRITRITRITASAADVRAPDGVRVRVQVLNATRTRGLARRATQLLRARGFDVVETGNARELRDSTLVLDRSGHPEWAARAAEVLGARVEPRPDSSRYLDVTVLLGATWRPPAEPFDP
jgi:hypothetical protein